MAISLLVIGGSLLWVGFQGNAADLFNLVVGDFKSGFLYWALAILAIGFVGAVPSLRGLANWFLVLVLVAIVLKNKNLVANAESAIGLKK